MELQSQADLRRVYPKIQQRLEEIAPLGSADRGEPTSQAAVGNKPDTDHADDARLKNLTGIEQIAGVEGALNTPHQVDLFKTW